MIACSNCGQKLTTAVAFCPKCGAQMMATPVKASNETGEWVIGAAVMIFGIAAITIANQEKEPANHPAPTLQEVIFSASRKSVDALSIKSPSRNCWISPTSCGYPPRKQILVKTGANIGDVPVLGPEEK